VKKILASILVVAIFIGGSLFTYHYYYGGTAYYTQITSSGEHDTDISDDGIVNDIYRYEQTAYNDDGEKKVVEMAEYRSTPLKEGAYLKLIVNPNKGVMRWEEVTAEEVPKKALTNITE